MPWTYHDFVALLKAREQALRRRDTRLVWWFGALLGSSTITAALSSKIGHRAALGGVLTGIVGLTFLAIYILVSARGYSRKHGVVCPHCGISLTEVVEYLDIVADDGAPLPTSVACLGCGAEIISSAA